MNALQYQITKISHSKAIGVLVFFFFAFLLLRLLFIFDFMKSSLFRTWKFLLLSAKHFWLASCNSQKLHWYSAQYGRTHNFVSFKYDEFRVHLAKVAQGTLTILTRKMLTFWLRLIASGNLLSVRRKVCADSYDDIQKMPVCVSAWMMGV